jgi:flavin-dependent dehydrogenase
MNIPRKCDVVVIGGGPSGSSVSTHLSRKGYNVVLLDRAQHPRRVVGESLLPHIWKFTDMLGVSEKIANADFIEKKGGIVNWDDKTLQLRFSDFGYTRPALHVEREAFDKILLDHADESGAQVYQGVAVTSVKYNGSNSDTTIAYKVVNSDETGEISCKYLADTSGPRSFLAKQLDMRQPDDEFRFVAIWGYFNGKRYVSAEGKMEAYENIRSRPPVTFVNSLGDWAWSWFIPMRKEISVGLLLPHEQLKQESLKGQQEATEYFLRRCESHPNLGKLLSRDDFIEGSLDMQQNYSFKAGQVAGEGFYIAGDAAGFVDPIYSNGVVSALYSGNLTAWAIDRSLRNPSSAATQRAIYTRQITGHIQLLHDLALPYTVSKEVPSELVKLLWAQNNTERALMFAVAVSTGRADNVYRIFGKEAVDKAIDGRLTELENFTI